ncbi:hypothetical protein [Shewanella mangrovisoli]|uniref:hypothetical protein n=1 Tax=Shewanella mangrovisoli TaxID=2864211 RepID=UPI0035B6CC86
MKRYFTAVLFLLFSQAALFSQVTVAEPLKWQTRLADHDAVIFASSTGVDSLIDAIAAVPKSVWIRSVQLSTLAQFDGLQHELHTYLQQHYPQVFADALASACNINNPKVVALREGFKEAILASGFVKQINSDFSARCERITSVDIEKFFITTQSSSPQFEAMLWLKTEQCH